MCISFTLGLVFALISLLGLFVPNTIMRLTGLMSIGSPIGLFIASSCVSLIHKRNFMKAFLWSSIFIIAYFLFFYMGFLFLRPHINIAAGTFFPPAPFNINNAFTLFFQWVSLSLIINIIFTWIIIQMNSTKSSSFRRALYLLLCLAFSGLIASGRTRTLIIILSNLFFEGYILTIYYLSYFANLLIISSITVFYLIFVYIRSFNDTNY